MRWRKAFSPVQCMVPLAGLSSLSCPLLEQQMSLTAVGWVLCWFTTVMLPMLIRDGFRSQRPPCFRNEIGQDPSFHPETFHPFHPFTPETKWHCTHCTHSLAQTKLFSHSKQGDFTHAVVPGECPGQQVCTFLAAGQYSLLVYMHRCSHCALEDSSMCFP